MKGKVWHKKTNSTFRRTWARRTSRTQLITDVTMKHVKLVIRFSYPIYRQLHEPERQSGKKTAAGWQKEGDPLLAKLLIPTYISHQSLCRFFTGWFLFLSWAWVRRMETGGWGRVAGDGCTGERDGRRDNSLTLHLLPRNRWIGSERRGKRRIRPPLSSHLLSLPEMEKKRGIRNESEWKESVKQRQGHYGMSDAKDSPGRRSEEQTDIASPVWSPIDSLIPAPDLHYPPPISHLTPRPLAPEWSSQWCRLRPLIVCPSNPMPRDRRKKQELVLTLGQGVDWEACSPGQERLLMRMLMARHFACWPERFEGWLCQSTTSLKVNGWCAMMRIMMGMRFSQTWFSSTSSPDSRHSHTPGQLFRITEHELLV